MRGVEDSKLHVAFNAIAALNPMAALNMIVLDMVALDIAVLGIAVLGMGALCPMVLMTLQFMALEFPAHQKVKNLLRSPVILRTQQPNT